MRTGVAVVDLGSGRIWTAGDSGLFGSGSVVKPLIATQIILDGQMSGSTAARAYEMIIGSNDDAASDLWARFGGPAIIDEDGAHYGIDIGAPNLRAGFWGNTQISAAGMARFFVAARNDSAVWPWLHDAMSHTKRIADDGTMQYFGIPAAGGGHVVKQGWGTASAGDGYTSDAVVHSTGIVRSAGSEYAIVILAQGHDDNALADPRGYEPALGAVVTAQARLILMNTGRSPAAMAHKAGTHPTVAGARTPASTAGSPVRPAGTAASEAAPGQGLEVAGPGGC